MSECNSVVECHVANVVVGSSNLLTRSNLNTYRKEVYVDDV